MTRAVGAAAVLILLIVSLAQPAHDEPCPAGTRSLSGQCPCPATTHLDAASGTCVADAKALSASRNPVVGSACDGGTVANGQCVCPGGFELIANGSATDGGVCAKRHTANCLGGELTVSGACLCMGQVVMDGATYDLELANGKCVPKRCPVETVPKKGSCVATSTTASPEPSAKTTTASPKKAEGPPADGERHHRCTNGMVNTDAGCVPARDRPSAQIGGIPYQLQRYYRGYQLRGLPSAAPGN